MEYENETELTTILSNEYFRELPLLHIGRGSNLLFLNDFNGIILHSAIKGITLIKETAAAVLIRVGAAEIWDDVVVYAVDKGWGGIENLSFIPGETGAAAVQNIGAYGVEIKDVIENVETINTLNFEKRFFSNEDCKYDYRTSLFKEGYFRHCEEERRSNPETSNHTHSYIITHVTLCLQKRPEFCLAYGNLRELLGSSELLTLSKIREAIIAIRRKKLPDPNELSNAGSFFINPVVTPEKLAQLIKDYPAIPYYPAKNGNIKLSAGWLIEQCGLKGQRFGQVGIYDQQALVIVNYGSATGSEIAQLADHICKTVYQHFDIQLVPEVKYIL
jgi:UDP-N-acetylmuramate dehydrogenase